ncbi:hypothetical protein J3F84DRAFT_364096 [Trichoderma pleuroticola]
MSLVAVIPSRGDDELCLGQTYILSILNTNEVLTAINHEDLKLSRFENSRRQMWRLDPCVENRHTFANVETGHCLGASRTHGYFCCKWDDFGPAEQFTFIPRKTGGYHVYNHLGDRPRLVTRQGNEDFLRTAATGNAFVTIGVHCAENTALQASESNMLLQASEPLGGRRAAGFQ